MTASEIDLAPSAWPPDDLEYYSALQRTNLRDHPPAIGRKGMVVGTTGALAIRSGVEALHQGGTAVDAAMTTALAQITLHAGAAVCFAGSMSLVNYEANTGELHYLNGAWDVPHGQASGYDIPSCGTPSGRQVLVHGFMAAVEAAHSRFGELPFEALFGPAIYFAEEGFEVDRILGWAIGADLDVITRFESGREIFLKPDGRPYRTGDWFRQPRLAETLTRVSKEGATYMYQGEWANRLVEAVQEQGGRLTTADLQAYEPMWLAPMRFEMDGFSIHAPNYPGYGGAYLRPAIESLDVDEMSLTGHYTVSEDSLAAMLRAVELGFGYDAKILGRDGSHSSGVVAVDERGNVAAVVHTINTWNWGATGIFVDGISISDVGCWAQRSITDAGPGGRMPTSENPLIVTHEGVPVAASSAIGTGLMPATLFSLINVLVYGMNPHQAVATPTFLQPGFGTEDMIHRAMVGDFSAALFDAVRNRGFIIDEIPLWAYPDSAEPGWWIGITIDPKNGVLSGATHDDWNGIALAQEIPLRYRRASGRRLSN